MSTSMSIGVCWCLKNSNPEIYEFLCRNRKLFSQDAVSCVSRFSDCVARFLMIGLSMSHNVAAWPNEATKINMASKPEAVITPLLIKLMRNFRRLSLCRTSSNVSQWICVTIDVDGRLPRRSYIYMQENAGRETGSHLSRTVRCRLQRLCPLEKCLVFPTFHQHIYMKQLQIYKIFIHIPLLLSEIMSK